MDPEVLEMLAMKIKIELFMYKDAPSSRLFGSGYAANLKPFLKRASGCFQKFGKIVLTPEGSTLKTDMCK